MGIGTVIKIWYLTLNEARSFYDGPNYTIRCFLNASKKRYWHPRTNQVQRIKLNGPKTWMSRESGRHVTKIGPQINWSIILSFIPSRSCSTDWFCVWYSLLLNFRTAHFQSLGLPLIMVHSHSFFMGHKSSSTLDPKNKLKITMILHEKDRFKYYCIFWS